jgi:hypothetical protein
MVELFTTFIILLSSGVGAIVTGNFIGNQIWNLYVYLNSLKKKETPKTIDNRPIYEKYPQLVYWVIGDNFYSGSTSFSYLGLADGRIVGKARVSILKPHPREYVSKYDAAKDYAERTKYKDQQIVEFSADGISKLDNASAKERQNKVKLAEVQQRIEMDSDNIYITELREAKMKLLAGQNENL